MFSSERLIILAFRFMINLELIFVWCEIGVKVFVFFFSFSLHIVIQITIPLIFSKRPLETVGDASYAKHLLASPNTFSTSILIH